jgi:rhamnogalacturonan endolyase
MKRTRRPNPKVPVITGAFLAMASTSLLVAACSGGGGSVTSTGGGGTVVTGGSNGSGGAAGTGGALAGTGGKAGPGSGGAAPGTGGTRSETGGVTGSGGSPSGTGGTTTGMGGRAGSGGIGTGAGGTALGTGGGTGGTVLGTGGGTGGAAGGKSGAAGSAGQCLPASNTSACSLIAQGTDYPGMYLTACPPATAHLAGAITPGGAAVTATKGNGSYTLDNGIEHIVITCASGTIKTWTYKGTDVLAGGNGGGQVYWELEAGNGTCTLTSDPTTNGGNQAEVRIHTTGSTNNLDVDIDYAMLRGSSGFYATGILTHPAAYAATNGGEWRSNVYNGSIFDWNSLDALRDGANSVGGTAGWLDTTENDWVNGSAVAGAPMEVEQAPNGVYVCKYSWTADWGDTDAWGWSSSAKNIGMFIALGSKEYYNGGPKKRELMGSMLNGPDLLNMLGGSHYEGAEAAETISAGTQLSKVYGPFFYYNNSVPAGTANANTVLFADAIAQARAEQAAWPYSWFVNPAGGDGNYVQQTGRGTVTGTLTIADTGAPGASSGDMWIGLAPDDGLDPQAQFFTYQYWVKTACDGSFTIPHVIPGTYALWAFGRGAAGTFTTATGKIPNSSILTPFTKPTGSIAVTAGQSQNLGIVTITPPRTAATVWEIGVPDRDSHEFLNGAINYTNWATSYETYAANFGKGVSYAVGTDDYSKVWNYSDMDTLPWTVNFTMGAAPTGQARLYVALAANEGGSLTVTVNGTQVGTLAPQNTSDAVTRLGSHGYFWDGQIVFAASSLKAGANTLTIKSSGAALEWDYLRLEANGT